MEPDEIVCGIRPPPDDVRTSETAAAASGGSGTGLCSNEAIHVVDAEADSFEMERGDGAGERVGFIEQARQESFGGSARSRVMRSVRRRWAACRSSVDMM